MRRSARARGVDGARQPEVRTYHRGCCDAPLGRQAESTRVWRRLAAARDMPEGIYEPQLILLKELARSGK